MLEEVEVKVKRLTNFLTRLANPAFRAHAGSDIEAVQLGIERAREAIVHLKQELGDMQSNSTISKTVRLTFPFMTRIKFLDFFFVRKSKKQNVGEKCDVFFAGPTS